MDAAPYDECHRGREDFFNGPIHRPSPVVGSSAAAVEAKQKGSPKTARLSFSADRGAGHRDRAISRAASRRRAIAALISRRALQEASRHPLVGGGDRKRFEAG
jgi:hypothetical protein